MAGAPGQRRRRQPVDGRTRRRCRQGSREPRSGGGARAIRARAADAEAGAVRLGQTARRLVGQARRALPVRAAVVPDHRRARVGQDHRTAQLRPQVSAGRSGRRPRRSRRRRHPPLRLVVHRPGGADRHCRPLHHARQRPRNRSQHLERVSQDVGQGPAAPARQRRAGHGVLARPADPPARRAGATRRHGSPARAGVAARPGHSLSHLPDGHQVRSDGRLHGLLRDARQRAARIALGLHLRAR